MATDGPTVCFSAGVGCGGGCAQAEGKDRPSTLHLPGGERGVRRALGRVPGARGGLDQVSGEQELGVGERDDPDPVFTHRERRRLGA